MLVEDKKRAAYRTLQDHILHGEGRAPTGLRAGAARSATTAFPRRWTR